MFTPNEIHRITGCLYLSTRSQDVQVTLGERVLDVTTGTTRDVDVVIARSGSTAMMAVEVKAEKNPLDTPLVEGLCLKLNDMPSISTKHIVSTAGFTKPALKKAEAHGVECLRLVSGQIPPFSPVDISGLRVLDYSRPIWLRHDLRLILSEDAPASVTSLLGRDLTSLGYSVRIGSNTMDLRTFRNSMLQKALSVCPVPKTVQEQEVRQTILLEPPGSLYVQSDEFRLLAVEISGKVRVERSALPLEQSLYLERPDGSPFAGAALIEVPEGLLGFAVEEGSNGLGVFAIPESVRNVRPTREIIQLAVPLP